MRHRSLDKLFKISEILGGAVEPLVLCKFVALDQSKINLLKSIVMKCIFKENFLFIVLKRSDTNKI